MNNIQTESYEYRKLVAQTKFAVIAPVIAHTFTDSSITAYFERIAENEIEWPDGEVRSFSPATFKDWLHIYRSYGFDGLMPKVRLDSGNSRKLSEEQQQFIRNMLAEFPKITGVMVYEKMVEKGLVTVAECSVDTVQRFIRTAGLRNSGNGPITKERRSWEYEKSCYGYEADTAHTFYIYDENGNYRKTYLIVIIDVHSRMIVGAEFFFNDNSANFHKVWHDAVLRYGRSNVMILDNGSTYKNKNTREIEARLGTKLIYNPPYTPVGKAIVERVIKSIRMRFLDVRHGSDYYSLVQLNDDLKKWVNDYNRKDHSALKDDECDNHTPLDRYMYDMNGIELWQLANKSPVEYTQWVDDVFMYEVTRKVNGDSTVLVENTRYDVPSIYIGSKVIIKYHPTDVERVYLKNLENKTEIKLKKTDKIENGKMKREEIMNY